MEIVYVGSMECTGLRVLTLGTRFLSVCEREGRPRGSFAMCTNGDYMGLCHA